MSELSDITPQILHEHFEPLNEHAEARIIREARWKWLGRRRVRRQRRAFAFLMEIGCKWQTENVGLRGMTFVHSEIGTPGFGIKVLNNYTREGFSIRGDGLGRFVEHLTAMHAEHAELSRPEPKGGL